MTLLHLCAASARRSAGIETTARRRRRICSVTFCRPCSSRRPLAQADAVAVHVLLDDPARLPADGPAGVRALLRDVRGEPARAAAAGARELASTSGARYEPPTADDRWSGRRRSANCASGCGGPSRTRSSSWPRRCATRSGYSNDAGPVAAAGRRRRAGWTRRGSTRTSCCRPGSGWRGTWRGMPSPGGRGKGSGCGSCRRSARRVPHRAGAASGVLLRVDELAPSDRLLLHERHLVSKELAGLDPPQGVRGGAAVILGEGGRA